MADNDAPNAPGQRVSDSEREQALERLRDALAEGRIDAADFDDRADRTLQARTAGDLAGVTADLPAQAGDKVLELRGVLGSVKREGNWLVPSTLRLHRRMGSVELDFTQADIRHPVVRIELDTIGGSIEIRVPEEASVSFDAVAVMLGSVQDHRKDAPAQGTPHFDITGQLRWGSLEVRGPKRKLKSR
jgi:Domain of unknown function (DUF1707)/Cell wall-active antibiotics response 4TMS YvqF